MAMRKQEKIQKLRKIHLLEQEETVAGRDVNVRVRIKNTLNILEPRISMISDVRIRTQYVRRIL